MNTRENPSLIPPMNMNVGGNVHVPPAVCPRPACVSAYTAADVGCTGSVRTNEFHQTRPMSISLTNPLFLELS